MKNSNGVKKFKNKRVIGIVVIFILFLAFVFKSVWDNSHPEIKKKAHVTNKAIENVLNTNDDSGK